MRHSASMSLTYNAAASLHVRFSFQWRQNDHGGVSNHQPHGWLLNHLFRRISKKTSKLRVIGLLCGEFTGTAEFPAQRASYAENFSIWWCHHASRNTCHHIPILGSGYYFTVWSTHCLSIYHAVSDIVLSASVLCRNLNYSCHVKSSQVKYNLAGIPV